MLPAKTQVNWPFDLGKEAKNRSSRWRPWWPSWISDRLECLLIMYKSPHCFLPSFKSFGLLVQEKKRKIEFLRWWPRRQSWIVDRIKFSSLRSTRPTTPRPPPLLPAPTMPPTKFQVSWLFFSGEEAKT